MSGPHPAHIATMVIRALVCAAICLSVIAPSAKCESKVHIRKKFIPKPHDWESIDRIAILPIEHPYDTDAASKSKNRTLARGELPADSTLLPLLDAMRQQIQLMDSSIIVFTVGKPTIQLPDSALAKVVGKISGADAVLTMRVTTVDYNQATPEMSGGYAMGAPLPPIGSKPASTNVQMTFTMKDVKYGEIIWQLDAVGKETAGGVARGSAEANPPGAEGLMKDIIIAAGSWLPFHYEQPE